LSLNVAVTCAEGILYDGSVNLRETFGKMGSEAGIIEECRFHLLCKAVSEAGLTYCPG
jgi:hypothetical protein